MGTQQILMIVLGVIVVGIAVSVGLAMFDAQSYSSNRSALASELQFHSTVIVQLWKMPTSLGGASMNQANITPASVGSALGFQLAGGVWSLTNENGEYRVISTNSGVVVVAGLGRDTKGGKHPYAEMTVDLLTSDISTTLSDKEAFD